MGADCAASDQTFPIDRPSPGRPRGSFLLFRVTPSCVAQNQNRPNRANDKLWLIADDRVTTHSSMSNKATAIAEGKRAVELPIPLLLVFPHCFLWSAASPRLRYEADLEPKAIATADKLSSDGCAVLVQPASRNACICVSSSFRVKPPGVFPVAAIQA